MTFAVQARSSFDRGAPGRRTPGGVLPKRCCAARAKNSSGRRHTTPSTCPTDCHTGGGQGRSSSRGLACATLPACVWGWGGAMRPQSGPPGPGWSHTAFEVGPVNPSHHTRVAIPVGRCRSAASPIIRNSPKKTPPSPFGGWRGELRVGGTTPARNCKSTNGVPDARQRSTACAEEGAQLHRRLGSLNSADKKITKQLPENAY